jgi:hypothetical protein
MADEKEQKRINLRSELDLALLTTDSVWGRNEIGDKFKEKTTKQKSFYSPKMKEDGTLDLDAHGKPQFEVFTEEDILWNTLSFFTRDFRLGNLSRWDGSLEVAEYYTNLASDFLHEGMKKPFNISISRVAAKLELSQSVGGFLRRRMGTFSQEHINIDAEPKNASLFGKAKREG